MARRSYNSAVRDQAREETHQRVFDATVRVVLDQGVHAFTMANVAKAAGVSHRTVYRHFPTREALLEGLARTLDRSLGGPETAIPPVPPVAEWEQMLHSTFDELAAQGERVRAVHAAAVALQYTLSIRGLRSAAARERAAEAFPRLEPERCVEAANMMRYLISSTCWLYLTVEQGMSTESAKRAASWALRTLIADLEARNASAEEVR